MVTDECIDPDGFDCLLRDFEECIQLTHMFINHKEAKDAPVGSRPRVCFQLASLPGPIEQDLSRMHMPPTICLVGSVGSWCRSRLQLRGDPSLVPPRQVRNVYNGI